MLRALALVLLVTACKPSASVYKTTPITNLQSYRTIGLRVRSTGYATQGIAMMMETAVAGRLRQMCQFESIVPAAQAPADLVLDLNVTNWSRGGNGFIRNENQIQIDTLLILSDGQDGQPMGTASIRGKSSGTVINNAPQENEAVDAIAKSIGEMLAKSGCTGPRVARIVTPPDQVAGGGGQVGGGGGGGGGGQGSGGGSAVTGGTGGTGAVVDETKRAEAEALNEQGKEKLFAADIPGALAAFQQAMKVLPDPKYQFNVCIALGAQERIAEAITACKQARAMNPPEKLAAKIDQRIDAMQQQQK